MKLDTRGLLLRLLKAIGDEDISDDEMVRALIILERLGNPRDLQCQSFRKK